MTPEELARERADAVERVVSLARQLVDTDRENRSYAGVMLKEAVRHLDDLDVAMRRKGTGTP